MTTDLILHAQALVDDNRYLTLGTTSANSQPPTSPVCFAAVGVREFFWVSKPDRGLHSRNLSERPHVSLVVPDSPVAPYFGRAVSRPDMPASCPVTRWTQGSPCIPDPTGQDATLDPRRRDRILPHIASIRQPPPT